MKIGIDIRVVKGEDGKKGLRVWPEVEGTENSRTYFVTFILVLLTIGSLWLIAQTPDPEIKPTVTIMGGY